MKKLYSKKLAITFLVTFFGWLTLFLIFSTKNIFLSQEKAYLWKFQSVDAMKYSRDLAREKMNDKVFSYVIDKQVESIAKTGATHIAIATPYDEEFIPYLKQWVLAARKYDLHVWFRGNWSGWEQWFDYPAIDRATHIKKTEEFILKNKDLFVDGDVFSACPECENGGPGDPRRGDVEGFRDFIAQEYAVTKKAFQTIHKKVDSNYVSMNADVARLVMDKSTTQSLDKIVTIDHYVAKPEKMIQDIHEIAEKSGGKVVIGEFGAPIPDIHGEMTQDQQAEWIQKTLALLAQSPDVVGINYWVNVGGSTELWSDAGLPKKGVKNLTAFYNARQLIGYVKDLSGDPIKNAKVLFNSHYTLTDKNGNFVLPYIQPGNITVTSKGYKSKTLRSQAVNTVHITLEPEKIDVLFRIRVFFHSIFKWL